jgi:hypothetical protein
MKKWTTTFAALALFGAVSANAADENRNSRAQQNEARRTAADVDRRIAALNRLDNNPSAFQAGLAAVSKETAVPLPTIEAEHKEHKTLGLAGLFMAHEISTKTHKPVETYIKQRKDGKTWREIARANNINLADLEQKLTRIEAAMQGKSAVSTSAGTSTSATREGDRTQVRAADTATSELDKRVAALNTLDDQPLQMRTGLASVSKETAVPLTQIEELQKQNASASLGDLFIAQELAVKTQKPASDFLRQRTDGKSWTQIISDHKQSESEIQQKLGRIEQAMRDAK